MITPPYLKAGDKIGIIAPARKVTPASIDAGLQLLRNAGFEIVEAKNLYGDNNQFSGSDNDRAHDVQDMIDRNDIKAIIAARGGWCCPIVDEVISLSIHNPEFIGLKILPVFHSFTSSNLGVETIHANVLTCYNDAFDPQSLDTLISALTGETLQYEWTTSEKNIAFNKHGEVTAEIIGGNLSLLHNLAGTESDMDVAGKILFIEDLDEYLYHIDRMMVQLKRCNKLELLAGLVVGGMTNMRDNEIPFGKTAEEIIHEHTNVYGYPVVFDFPAGHTPLNSALILGREATLVVGDSNQLIFHEGDDS
nr:LD-carboxypeptidase [Bacteroidota bacterium]